MKSLTKLMCAKAVLFLMTTSAAAVTINQSVFNWFTDPNGNVGFIDVVRRTDPATKVTITTLSYSFCVATMAASCLEGSGVIPNSAFSGTLTGTPFRAETVKLLADTTVAGFSNQLCNGPDSEGDCSQGASPATGGPISVTYVTKTGSIEVLTNTDFKRENFKVTLNSTDQNSQGPATENGLIFGTTVNPAGGAASWTLEKVSGLGSGAHAKTAQSHSTLEESLAPPVRRRLQRLRGEKPVE